MQKHPGRPEAMNLGIGFWGFGYLRFGGLLEEEKDQQQETEACSLLRLVHARLHSFEYCILSSGHCSVSGVHPVQGFSTHQEQQKKKPL